MPVNNGIIPLKLKYLYENIIIKNSKALEFVKNHEEYRNQVKTLFYNGKSFKDIVKLPDVFPNIQNFRVYIHESLEDFPILPKSPSEASSYQAIDEKSYQNLPAKIEYHICRAIISNTISYLGAITFGGMLINMPNSGTRAPVTMQSTID